MNEIDKYLSGVSIVISDVGNREKSFKGIEQIEHFFEKEKAFWSDPSFSKINNSIIGKLSDFHSGWLDSINEIKKHKNDPNLDDNDKYRIIQQRWTSLHNALLGGGQNNRRILFSDTIEARHFKNISHLGLKEVDGAWKYFFSKTNDNNLSPNNKEYFKAYLHAYEFEREQEDGIGGIISAEQDRLNDNIEDLNTQTAKAINYSIEERDRVSNEWNEQKSNIAKWEEETKKHNEEYTQEVNNKIESVISEHISKLEEIEDTYTRKLELEGPVELWKKRVKNYRKQTILWFSILTVSSISSIILLLYILKLEPHAIFREGKKFMIDPSAIFGVILLATVVSFAAFVIRISAKIALSSLHLSRDAEEREQLTRVYLGLKMEGKVDVSSESLILDALFSRAQTGLLKEDSAPTMPGIDAALKKLIK